MKEIAAIILAGGESKRMKCPKAFLKFNDHLTFVEKIVDTYEKAGIKKMILVINHSFVNSENEPILSKLHEKVKVITNEHPEKGRLYSLKLGLKVLNELDACFIQNIDNPFVESFLLQSSIPLMQEGSFVSPVFKGNGGHPVLLSPVVCRHILKIQTENVTLRDVLAKFKKIIFPYNESVLININTPSDYQNYFY